MTRALAFGLAVACAAGVAGAAAAPSGDPWKQLRRPLHLPTLARGERCLVSAPDTSVDFASYSVGQGYGPGPAYPVFGPRAGFDFRYPSPYHSAWSGNKVLWFLLPGSGGRALVRGRQLDGQYSVGFGLARTPATELRLTGAGDHAAETRVRAPGCYAYQIDGPSYSRTIVFQTKLTCLAARVHGNRVQAGPFTGVVMPRYDVVDGRFRLHVGRWRDPATHLSQKLAWLLPRRHRGGETLSVRAHRLSPPVGTFTDTLYEAWTAHTRFYVSAFEPPKAGCWRFTFRTAKVKGSLVALVSNE